MDFLLFYSKFSNHCSRLLDEVPLLYEKTVCVDSPECRKIIENLSYKIERVPTLLIVDGVSKIIKVIEGYPDIKNWFMLTTYSLSSGMPTDEQPHQQEIEKVYPEIEDELLPPPMPVDNNITMIGPQTEAEESEEYVLKSEKAGGVKSLAEELQRQRETFLESSEPMKSRT